MATDGPLFPIVDGKYRMDREPIVGIGVILDEDAMPAVHVRVAEDGCRIAGADEHDATALAPGEYVLRRANGGVVVEAVGTCTVLRAEKTAPVRLLGPERGGLPRPGDGFVVRDVVAGRGFHWRRTHDVSLTGDLEFHAPAGSAHLAMVNRLPLEEYLTGVITGEMSGECPIEFMKAQATAARSWLLGQPKSPHPGQPFHWCNDDCCQRYQGSGGWSERAVQAIDECRGQVLITRSNRYCDARYSKSTGGVSEDASSVWGYEIEGLTARLDAPAGSAAARFYPVTEKNIVEYIEGAWAKTTDCFASPTTVPEDTITRYLGRVDVAGQYFRWTIVKTQAELRESLSTRGGIADLAEVLDLRPGKRGRSGRLEELHVDYRASGGERKTATIRREYHIRAGLSKNFLFSSCILIHPKRAANGALESVELRGAGWGHGAGLCQIGGLGRALKAQGYEEILAAYYTDVRLERIYE